MRRDSVSLAVTAVLMLALCAVPASANKVKDKDGVPAGLKDTGTLAGTATQGKLRRGCLEDGTSLVEGAGLGTLGPSKNAYWEFGNQDPMVAHSLVGVFKVGLFKACGRSTQMFSAVAGGIGASCRSSKGWDGKGTISYPDDGDPTRAKDTIWLKELGWKASVTTFVMTGTADQGPTAQKPDPGILRDVVVIMIQLSGLNTRDPCLNKESDKSVQAEGGRRFIANGTYTIANGPYLDPNSAPITCKSGLAEGCLSDPKQPGASG